MGGFRGRSVAQGQLPASPGSRILMTHFAASEFGTGVRCPLSKGVLGRALPNSRRGVPGVCAGVTEPESSSAVSVAPGGRSAADPAQAGRVPDGGKPWGWVVIETLLSPAELGTTGTAPRPSTVPQHRAPAPQLGSGWLWGMEPGRSVGQ